MTEAKATVAQQKTPRHVRDVMALVLLALVPAIATHWFVFGPGILIQIILASGFAYALEAMSLRLRGRPVMMYLSDHSAVLTGVLFALSIPPLSPWWVSATGMVFAIVVAKHLYGGLGHNLFNPAMVGFAAVIIAFPEPLTHWLTPLTVAEFRPDWMLTLNAIVTGQLPTGLSWDSLSQATPLDQIRQGLANQRTLSEITEHPMFGPSKSTGWSWVVLAYFIGGLFLIWKKVITWHVPATILIATVVLTTPGWLLDADQFRSPLQQLSAGALVMAAFFIATDPVSGSATPRGKIIFSIGVVVITLAIRAWGGFPDGVAFAILLMNLCVPLIDAYTRPRIYGHRSSTLKTTEEGPS